MKRCLAILIFIIPLSMMLNVYQSKRYLKARSTIRALLREQNQLLEENQRIIAEIARNSAPTAIERIAQDDSGGTLSKIRPEQVLRIIVPEEDESP